jgi:hypothetical protein
MDNIEIIGLIGSILIVFSMIFKTTNYKGTIAMRVINSVGSIFFIVYGFVLPAIASGVTNSILLILNIFYLIKEIRDHRAH